MSTEVWWGSGSTPAWRVLLGFAVKGVPYTSHQVSFSAGDTRKPEFLAINPRGKVPVIRDGSFALAESLAILAWLDRKHPDPPLFGRTPEAHGEIWRWCFEQDNYLSSKIDAVVRPIFGGRADVEGDAIRAAIPGLHEELDRLETAVGSGYLVGDAVSAADLVWFAAVAFLIRGATRPAASGLDLGILPLGERYPKILAWTGRIEALPGYEATIPPHWLEGENRFPRPLR